MKNKFIKLALIGVISTGVLISSSTVFASDLNNKFKSLANNKNIVLLAQKDGLQDGKYNVSIQTLKEKSEELSMAGQYIDANAVLDVQEGNMYLTVNVLRNDWMKNIRVLVDEASVNYKHEAQGKDGKVAKLKFTIPNKKPNIRFKMNVVPMGNAEIVFRLALNEDITKISGGKFNNKVISENSSNEKVTGKNSSNEKVTGENSSNEKVTGENSSNEKVTGENSSNEKVTSKNSSNRNKKEKEKELPQTGFPISGCNILIMGGASTLLGIGLLKKRK